MVFDANVVIIVVMATNLNSALWRKFVESRLRNRNVESGVFDLDVAPILGYIECRCLALTMCEPLHILIECPVVVSRIEVLLGEVAYFAS